KGIYIAVLMGIVLLYFGSAYVTEFHMSEGLASFPGALSWIGKNLIPDDQAISRIPKILSMLLETTLLSVAVTVSAAVCAFMFSLLGTRTTKINPVIGKMVRVVAAFFRNVPDVVWAMILMFSFGQNILTGFLALFFTTFGLLTRAFIETIDEVSSSCVEALNATGANFIQCVFQGIIPSSLTGIVSWVLYMIETNIRSSTLIGMLTSTGIGYLFDMYYKGLQFPSAGLIVFFMVILVIAIEGISNKVRRVIM
ncbi:MAG: PhnE/PtxC family ABC transporter permease, partial [Anaerovoracaceae bacterium]